MRRHELTAAVSAFMLSGVLFMTAGAAKDLGPHPPLPSPRESGPAAAAYLPFAPLGLAIDSAGNSWAVFTATSWVASDSAGAICNATPARLYEWTGHRWAAKSADALRVAFGPRDQLLMIRGHLPRGSAPWSGTLIVDEPGSRLTVANNVVTVAAPQQ